LLLSVSKALRVARDLPHRYRARAQGGVPRFGGGMELGRKLSRDEEGERRMRRLRCAEMKTEMKNAVERADGEKGTPGTKCADGPKGPGLRTAGGARGARLARRWWDIGGWFSLERLGLRKRAVSGGGSGPALGPVQQELSLENLKPCRNDLSDADWELAEPPASGAKLAFLRQLASSGQGASKGGKEGPRGGARGVRGVGI
jgi:hypothetical protein